MYISLYLSVVVLFWGMNGKLKKVKEEETQGNECGAACNRLKLMEKEQRRRVQTYIGYISLSPEKLTKILSQKHHPVASAPPPWTLGDLARSAATPKNGKELSEMEKVERQALLR